jgi:quercetin dioxygenase-like cupin family protein
MFDANVLQAHQGNAADTAGVVYLAAGETHQLECSGQTLRIVSGTAWVSYRGQDYIVGAGDSLAITAGTYPAIASAMRSKPVTYRLEEN